jgi:3-oxoacyl-[acyl-carrier-protein] synthase II
LLASGDLDLAIAGGYDPISEYAYAGFNSMRLVSPTTVRPFAVDRDGMKVAEGYAVAVLERPQTAIGRGAAPLAYVLGMGESCDAFHLSKPHPEGAGAAVAIGQALHEAALAPGDIDLIIAHGTATLDNDAAEYAALKLVFGEGLPRMPLLATKSHLGHSLGAAGAVDLIIAVLALREGLIPPCANLSSEAALIGGINPMRGGCRPAALRRVLTVSLGFGGANMACVLGAATVIAERPKASEARLNVTASRLGSGPDLRRTGSARRVAISGIGVVVPGGAGNEAFVQLLGSHKEGRGGRSSTVTQEELEPLINARRTRRMSEFAKLAIAATGEALRHAEVALSSVSRSTGRS